MVSVPVLCTRDTVVEFHHLLVCTLVSYAATLQRYGRMGLLSP